LPDIVLWLTVSMAPLSLKMPPPLAVPPVPPSLLPPVALLLDRDRTV
jgi:hypothetical protein